MHLRLCLGGLEVLRSLFQAKVALLVCSSGTETNSSKCRPCSSLEQEDREDDTESETEGRFNEEIRETAIPLVVKKLEMPRKGDLLVAGWPSPSR